MYRGANLTRAVLALMIAITLGTFAGFGGGSIARAVAIECAVPTPVATATGTQAPTAEPAPAVEALFPESGGELTVFAAASLTDSFTQIAADLETAHPGLAITLNFAGSPALVTQLTEGAAADVFASASKGQMDKAAEAGVIDGNALVFTQNRLAIVVPVDNPGGVQGPADLAKDGLKLVVAQAEVPVGQYARQAICNANAAPVTYGEGFAGKVAANIVSEEDSVRAVLAKVQLGEADAGIVYTTDVNATVASDVMIIEIPASINVAAKYPIAPVKGGNAELAAAFIAYVVGSDGQATLQSFGFEPKP